VIPATEVYMSMTQVVLFAVAAVLLVLYIGRRRARLRRDDSERG
jgi:hypothetical protein